MAIPVYLLPGLDGTGRMFASFVAAAPDTLSPRVIDYPTDRVQSYLTLENLVRARLPKDGRFALLGESFSGPVAIRIAASPPAGLSALVLVATFHRRPAHRSMQLFRPLLGAVDPRRTPAFAVRRFLTGADAPPSLVEEVQRTIALVDKDVFVARLRETLDVDVTRALSDCHVPILYLGARDDRLLRSGIAEEIRAIRPETEVRTLPAPHLVLQCLPGEAMAIVGEFLARTIA